MFRPHDLVPLAQAIQSDRAIYLSAKQLRRQSIKSPLETSLSQACAGHFAGPGMPEEECAGRRHARILQSRHICNRPHGGFEICPLFNALSAWPLARRLLDGHDTSSGAPINGEPLGACSTGGGADQADRFLVSSQVDRLRVLLRHRVVNPSARAFNFGGRPNNGLAFNPPQPPCR
jgi:hypothetical protein